MRADDVLARFSDAQRSGSGWTARCPAHDDRERSLSIAERDGRVLLKCFAGCATEDVVAAVGLTLADLFTEPKPSAPKPTGLTVAALAAAKRLDPTFLAELGVKDERGVVVIPYADADGNVVAIRRRHALTGARFTWRKGDRPTLYGLDRLRRSSGPVLVVEGESDCWALWAAGIAAVGVPGKAAWREEFAGPLRGREVVVWQEPDAADFVERIARDLPDVRVIVADEFKDPADVHAAGHDLAAYITARLATARPAAEIVAAARDRRRAERHAGAKTVLDHPDPLALVESAIRAGGWGGDLRAPLLVYLAMTTRLLAHGDGAMLAHCLLIGPPSAGKSTTVAAARRLLPDDAVVEIDAGSPRVLIYDTTDLSHKVVIFGEADSLPAGEDNPAASAIRAVLQEGRLRYKVVVRDPESGDFTVRDIDRAGPTVLITTAVRRLGEQLQSRFWVVEVPDDQAQIRAALGTRGAAERNGIAPAPAALIAFQQYLQELAPIEVFVPFADVLARLLGRAEVEPTVIRDFTRTLSLVRAAAILRLAHRERDERGRIVADLDDYAAVYPLIKDAFQSANAASPRARAAVEAVAALRATRGSEVPVRRTEVAAYLGLPMKTAWRYVQAALKGGWLVNRESRPRQPADLDVGEPLPPDCGLPSPDELAQAVGGIDPAVSRDHVTTRTESPSEPLSPVVTMTTADHANEPETTLVVTLSPQTAEETPPPAIPVEDDYPRSAWDVDDITRALGVVPDEPYQPDPDPDGLGVFDGDDLPEGAIWARSDVPAEIETRDWHPDFERGAVVPEDTASLPTDPLADEDLVWSERRMNPHDEDLR